MSATGVNLVTFLKDVKSSGTAGGTATSGSYQTRTLNTQEGDTSFCVLSANQFTLNPGTYLIEAHAPIGLSGGNFTLSHKAKIANITDSTDAIIGTAETADAAGAGVTMSNKSICFGVVTITSAKTFQLQHKVNSTVTVNGFGVAASFGDNEVYSVVKITKLY